MTSNRYDIDDEIYITDLLSDKDIPSFVKYLNNRTISANTLKIPYPYTTNDGEDFIKMIKSSSSDSTNLFTVRKTVNDELIGECSLNRSITNERIAEIGYWLGEPFWHRGLMSKVARKVIEITKNKWENIIRIEAYIYSWNKGSMRVAEKCGFVFEGLLREPVQKNGEDIDVNLYALTL